MQRKIGARVFCSRIRWRLAIRNVRESYYLINQSLESKDQKIGGTSFGASEHRQQQQQMVLLHAIKARVVAEIKSRFIIFGMLFIDTSVGKELAIPMMINIKLQHVLMSHIGWHLALRSEPRVGRAIDAERKTLLDGPSISV